MNSNSKAVNNESKATFAEMMDRKAWTMTVERKETRTGNVSFIHTVYFQGEVFDTRKSKREYKAYWLDVAKGRPSENAKKMIEYMGKQAKKYRASAEKGGESYPAFRGRGFHSPEQFIEWADNAEKTAQANRELLADIEAAGPEFDYSVVDGGFCGRPDLCKGNLSVIAGENEPDPEPTKDQDKDQDQGVEFQGDTWDVVNTGEERDGKTLAHLRSRTRTETYRNQERPLELVEFVDNKTLGNAAGRLEELFGDIEIQDKPKRIRVVSSCTARKHPVEGPVPARDLYAGEQHKRLLRGVDSCPDGLIALEILSAGYGLIPANFGAEAYDHTFAGKSSQEIAKMAERLDIPNDVRDALEAMADLTIVALGDDYLQACQLPEVMNFDHPVVFVYSRSSAGRIPKGDNVFRAELRESDTRAFRSGLVGLKGEVVAQYLENLEVK